MILIRHRRHRQCSLQLALPGFLVLLAYGFSQVDHLVDHELDKLLAHTAERTGCIVQAGQSPLRDVFPSGDAFDVPRQGTNRSGTPRCQAALVVVEPCIASRFEVFGLRVAKPMKEPTFKCTKAQAHDESRERHGSRQDDTTWLDLLEELLEKNFRLAERVRIGVLLFSVFLRSLDLELQLLCLLLGCPLLRNFKPYSERHGPLEVMSHEASWHVGG